MDTRTLHILEQTTEFNHDRGQQAFLVGGALRNVLLGEPVQDWDVVISGNATKTGRALADTLGGYYVPMHEKAVRVVIRLDEGTAQRQRSREMTIDIASMKGGSIEEDVRQRDFTVNALAAPLEHVVRFLEHGKEWVIRQQDSLGVAEHEGRTQFAHEIRVIDPTGGLIDLEGRRLRAVDAEVFRHDPLRLLRAVRLMARYRLNCDTWTGELMVRDAALLPQVAAERIHDEVYALLEGRGAIERLRLLDRYGLLTKLFPELELARGMSQPSVHSWDVLEHSLQALAMLEQVAGWLQAEAEEHPQPVTFPGEALPGQEKLEALRQLLSEAEEQGMFAWEILESPAMKLAALLHDCGKPTTFARDAAGKIHFYQHPQKGAQIAVGVMRRLKASGKDQKLVRQVVGQHMRPLLLSQQETITPRAMRRYFIELGATGILVALFSLADHLATVGPQVAQVMDAQGIEWTGRWERHLEVARLLLHTYIRQREQIMPQRLLGAEELMQHFKLKPGQMIGQLLDELAEAQTEGHVQSREEALRFVGEKLDQRQSETRFLARGMLE